MFTRVRGALTKARGLKAARRLAALLLVAAASFVAAVAPRVEFVDDAEVLSRVSPIRLLEDQLVRGAVGRFEAGRFVIVLADTIEDALARNDEVARRLDAAVAEGSVAEHRSLHTFLWSEALQRENLAAFTAARDAGLAERLRVAFDAAGLRGEAFVAGLARATSSNAASVTSDDATVLRWAELAASPLAPLVRPFVIEREDVAGVAVIGHLRGVTDVERLRASVEAVEGVRLFDRKASMRAAWRAHRVQILWVASLGFLGVTLLVFLRHRDVAKTVRAVLPALLAASFTICVRSFVGPPLHLLDVVAALLVLSMGADYGVFLVESTTLMNEPGAASAKDAGDEVAATLVAMLVASLTTVWGFGTLALATNPAMQAIGLTTAVGVASALLFAMLVHGVGSTWSTAGRSSGGSAVTPAAKGPPGLVVALVIGAASMSLGCASGGVSSASARHGAAPRVPTVDPAALPFDAALRQTVTTSRGSETFAVDVALEMNETRVVMVGVLPFGGRVFTLVATAEGVEATVLLPDRVPIDATLVYLDMARALLVDPDRAWSGKAPSGSRRRGRSSLGRYVERWRNGCLVERRYGGQDPLHIRYDDPWCRGALPRRMTLAHPRLALFIEIETIAGQATPRPR
jgi:hypothetical protein